MSSAEERALEKYPKRKDGRTKVYYCTDEDVRKVYAQGYRKSEKEFMEKAEKWLEEHSFDYFVTDGDGYISGIHTQKLIDDFKQFMSE